jgi:hypothetical protein
MVMEVMENLTEDFFGRLNSEVRPAATDRGSGSFLARTACWENGKVKWSWATQCSGERRGRGVFYRAEEVVEGRGDGRWRSGD